MREDCTTHLERSPPTQLRVDPPTPVPHAAGSLSTNTLQLNRSHPAHCYQRGATPQQLEWRFHLNSRGTTSPMTKLEGSPSQLKRNIPTNINEECLAPRSREHPPYSQPHPNQRGHSLTPSTREELSRHHIQRGAPTAQLDKCSSPKVGRRLHTASGEDSPTYHND